MRTSPPLRPTLLAIAALCGVLGVVAGKGTAGKGTIVATQSPPLERTLSMQTAPDPGKDTDPGPSTAAKPIKVPNPPEDGSGKVEPEVPKVGSRDAPGG